MWLSRSALGLLVDDLLKGDESMQYPRSMSDTHSQTRAFASDYREFLPPVALREHVLCLWTQSIQRSRAVYAHRVLPDACVDIVFMQGQGQAPAIIGP
jgi:hypothetical protein